MKLDFFDSFFTIIRKCQAELKIRESDRCRDERPRTHTSAALRIHRISISSSRGEDLSFFVLFLIYETQVLRKNETPNLCSMSERKRHSSFLSCRPNDTRKDKKKIIITKQFFRKIVMNTTSNEDFRAVFFFSY